MSTSDNSAGSEGSMVKLGSGAFKNFQKKFSSDKFRDDDKKDKNSVPRDCIGTAYLDLLCTYSVNYQGPSSAYMICLNALMADVGDVSDNSSNHSGDTITSTLTERDLPVSMRRLILQFCDVLRTPSSPERGLRSFAHVGNQEIVAHYHWSRHYIRNPKSVIVSGIIGRRATFSPPAMTDGMGGSYVMKLECIFT
ncbi:TPA_asm: P7 [Chrysanthemum trirhavirus 1]|nr:TPA_asm: P7 [Chrysanthemum trirhavirus 1]